MDPVNMYLPQDQPAQDPESQRRLALAALLRQPTQPAQAPAGAGWAAPLISGASAGMKNYTLNRRVPDQTGMDALANRYV